MVVADWMRAGEEEEDIELRVAELGRPVAQALAVVLVHQAELERLHERYGVTSISRQMHWSGTVVRTSYFRGRGRDDTVEDVTAEVVAGEEFRRH